MRHAVHPGPENLDGVNERECVCDDLEVLLVCGLDNCFLDILAWLVEGAFWEPDSLSSLVEELDVV
jgi:hypothetical protein